MEGYSNLKSPQTQCIPAFRWHSSLLSLNVSQIGKIYYFTIIYDNDLSGKWNRPCVDADIFAPILL